MKTQEMFLVTPPSATTSLLEDDDRGHDSAMLDGKREVKPRG
jgi:hypothetical protein